MTDDAELDAVYSCIDRGIQPGGLKRKRKGCGKAAERHRNAVNDRRKAAERRQKEAKGSKRQQKTKRKAAEGSRKETIDYGNSTSEQ